MVATTVKNCGRQSETVSGDILRRNETVDVSCQFPRTLGELVPHQKCVAAFSANSMSSALAFVDLSNRMRGCHYLQTPRLLTIPGSSSITITAKSWSTNCGCRAQALLLNPPRLHWIATASTSDMEPHTNSMKGRGDETNKFVAKHKGLRIGHQINT